MQLISKQDMITKEWLSFDRYPQQGSDIILHIRGYYIRENKYCHDFVRLFRFHAMYFDKRDYTPKIKSVVWDYSWLPVKALEQQ